MTQADTSRSEGIPTTLSNDAGTMARGASVTFVSLIAASVLTMVFTLLGTHLVPVSRFGLFSLASTVITLAMVPALLGLDTAVTRFVAIEVTAGRHDGARATLQTALGVSAALSMAVTALLVAFAPWICGDALSHPGAAPLLRITALGLPALVLAQVTVAGLQGLGLMRITAWINPSRAFGSVLFGAMLLAVGTGVRGLAIAATAGAWLSFLVAVITLARVDRSTFSPAGHGWPVKRLLRFSTPQTFTAVLFVTVLWTDTLLLAHFKSSASVAIYSTAGKLLVPATLVSTAVSQMFAPRIAAQSGARTPSELSPLLKRVTRWNTMVSLPVFLVLIVAPSACLGIFGHRYPEGATALAILALGQLLNTAAGPLGQVINMMGRPYLTLLNNAAVAGLNIVTCLVLIPRYGMVGAAISTTSALTLVNLIKIVQVRVLFSVTPFEFDTIRVIIAGIVAAVGTYGIIIVVPGLRPLVEACFATGVLLLAYVALLTGFALAPEDRALSAGVIRRVFRRVELPAR